MTSVTPFLMFQVPADDAIRFYISLFKDGEILEMTRYQAGEQGAEGTIKLAKLRLAGQTLLCTHSPIRHGFDFTPSFSLFVGCDSEEELRRLAAALGEGGQVLMGIADYGFSRLFTWLNDKYGVSWQLNLA